MNNTEVIEIKRAFIELACCLVKFITKNACLAFLDPSVAIANVIFYFYIKIYLLNIIHFIIPYNLIFIKQSFLYLLKNLFSIFKQIGFVFTCFIFVLLIFYINLLKH